MCFEVVEWVGDKIQSFLLTLNISNDPDITVF